MFERNDDVLYICYDNEGYMNTGVQRSSATPPAARTATTPAVGDEPGNVFGTGKSVPQDRGRARHPLCRDRDRRRPARSRAQGDEGHGHPWRALHPDQRALPARLGRGVARHDPARAARRRMRPLSRSSRPSTAKSRTSARSGGRFPCEDYLKRQRRFAHLFKGGARRPPREAAAGDVRRQYRRLRPARRHGDEAEG